MSIMQPSPPAPASRDEEMFEVGQAPFPEEDAPFLFDEPPAPLDEPRRAPVDGLPGGEGPVGGLAGDAGAQGKRKSSLRRRQLAVDHVMEVCVGGDGCALAHAPMSFHQ